MNNNILIIGCGAVARCTLSLLFQKLNVHPSRVTVIDIIDVQKTVQHYVDQGMHFVIKAFSQDTYSEILAQYLEEGDICIDVANETGTLDLLTWCQEHGVMFLNTNINYWYPSQYPTLFDAYEALCKQKKSLKNGPTSILAHGANPGLISSFTKKALLDFGSHILQHHSEPQKIAQALEKEDFKLLTRLENIQVVHIAEKDTLNAPLKKMPDTFYNTWSTIEFVNECTAPAEISWGTHEKQLPLGAELRTNSITLPIKALHCKLTSWVPDEEIVGITPIHDEIFMLAEYLTTYKNNEIAHRPTVVFVYDPCLLAKQSLQELEARNFQLQSNRIVLDSQINSGIEKMGCLLLSPDYGAWWTGSILSTEEAIALAPGHNAVVLHVAAGLISALLFMLKNPQLGVLFPEDLNHHEILEHALPYLGTLVSKASAWRPHKNKEDLQFQNFLVDKAIF